MGQSQGHVLQVFVKAVDEGGDLVTESTVDFFNGGGRLALDAQGFSDLLGEFLVENG